VVIRRLLLRLPISLLVGFYESFSEAILRHIILVDFRIHYKSL
jgi:hypothetical protein